EDPFFMFEDVSDALVEVCPQRMASLFFCLLTAQDAPLVPGAFHVSFLPAYCTRCTSGARRFPRQLSACLLHKMHLWRRALSTSAFCLLTAQDAPLAPGAFHVSFLPAYCTRCTSGAWCFTSAFCLLNVSRCTSGAGVYVSFLPAYCTRCTSGAGRFPRQLSACLLHKMHLWRRALSTSAFCLLTAQDAPLAPAAGPLAGRHVGIRSFERLRTSGASACNPSTLAARLLPSNESYVVLNYTGRDQWEAMDDELRKEQEVGDVVTLIVNR
ncbi:hypothetical protein CYMTET_30424, partial [Cymbomonas tetramitiformis]